MTAAALLGDAGYQAEVYERTPVPLSGFGTGIVMQPELARYFVERTDIGLDRISVPSSAMRYFDAASGELVGEIEATWRYTSYNALYRGLLTAVGDDRYHLGQALVGIDQRDERVELRFAGGRVAHCDLAIAADGCSSVARQRLLGIAPSYAGYISWRGTVPRSQLSTTTWDFFADRFTYGLLDDGHILAYPIPVVSDELEIVDQQINFQWYMNLPEGGALEELMTDRDGIRRPVSVHSAGVQQRHVDALHERAQSEVSVPAMVELMTAAPEPFITMILDAAVPRMRVGRVCLIGDAAFAVRPHAAAGAAKAALNAWELVTALEEADGDVDVALAGWEPAQLELGSALLAKVRYMGSLLQHGGPFLPGDPKCRFGLEWSAA